MKYDSQSAYIDGFAKRIRTVSGRDEAEREVTGDIAKFEELRQRIRKSVEERDAEISRIRAETESIFPDRSSYLVKVIVKILNPRSVATIRKHNAEIAKLTARRARLFGKELPLTKCLEHIDQLIAATRTVLYRIEENRSSHAMRLEWRSKERAAKKADHKNSLEPYRKRIELGEAALGKTRMLASIRKKSIIA